MTRIRLVHAVVAAAAATAVLGACAPAPESDPTGTATPATTTTTTTDSAGPGGATEAQAADLCARMEGQLSNWRTYTPSVGRGGLNILVGEWGVANGVDLLALAGDRARIDTITSEQCPQVREEAIAALEIPDLAAGLVGY